ncbi:hypothetical protein ACWDSL_35775 [Streptomyces sp. NPDC000941]
MDFYRRINDRVNELLGGHESAELLLASVNFAVVDRCDRDWLGSHGVEVITPEAAGREFVQRLIFEELTRLLDTADLCIEAIVKEALATTLS